MLSILRISNILDIGTPVIVYRNIKKTYEFTHMYSYSVHIYAEYIEDIKYTQYIGTQNTQLLNSSVGNA